MDIIYYQHIRQNCGCKTRLQDNYPYDEFILGISGIYHTVGDDSYFINSNSIVSPEHILTTGRTYLLQENQTKELTIVKLIEAYYHDGYANLIVQEIKDNNCLKSIKCIVPCKANDCPWRLIDVEFLLATFNISTRLMPDKKSIIDTELLEFDF